MIPKVRPDPNRVRLASNHEARYWMQVLATSRDKLERAVIAVGNEATAVRLYLDAELAFARDHAISRREDLPVPGRDDAS